jgi:hypothetical protein
MSANHPELGAIAALAVAKARQDESQEFTPRQKRCIAVGLTIFCFALLVLAFLKL